MQLYRRALLCCALYCVNSVVAQVTSNEQFQQEDLQRQLPADQLLQLTALQQNFTVLQQETLTSYTKGTAILLPDTHEHAASPKHINYLRQQLPLYGWHTLALMPPSPSTRLDQQNLADYQQQLFARLQAAQQQALQNPGSIIMIAQGTSAAVINLLLAQEQLTEPAALIMLGAYLPDSGLNQQIAPALAQHQVATLELSHQLDNLLVADQLVRRQQLANKAMKAVYRQRQLTGSGYNTEIQAWTKKEILGWLASLGF